MGADPTLGSSSDTPIDVIGSYRFDDPDGRVGMETHLVTAAGTLRWKTTIAPFAKPPIVGGDGTIYIGSDDHSLYAVGAEGKVRWSVATGGGINGQPALGADGTLYIASADGFLYAIGP